MDDRDYRVTEARIDERMRSAARPGTHREVTPLRRDRWAPAKGIGHARPPVHALPRPTAHPTDGPWQWGRFARLQRRLTATTITGRGASRRSVVLLPSRSVDRWHEPPAETRSYEERLLSFLFDLHDPGLDLTYVTSLPLAQRTVDYYLSLLPRRLRYSARKRLRFVSVGDAGQQPLSEKLLERPRVLAEIRRSLAHPDTAYLMPYNSTAHERDLALALEIPLYGPDPDHAWLGTKSGSRTLFAQAGLPHPLGIAQIRTIPDAVNAICALRAQKPELAELVIKLDLAVSGEGNALLDLAGLPEPGAFEEGALIQQRLERLAPAIEGVGPAAYLRKLAEHGGVVEERITGRELRSPSVQLEITPAGAVMLLSTHDQILHGRNGQQFAGCRFPADPGYAPMISALAQRAAEHLADAGLIGRLAIDFLVIRAADDVWQPFALEVNLRMGGTTHPYQTLAGLTGGSYDPATASFTTPGGYPRHYVATDHCEIPQLQTLGRAGVVARATRAQLGYDNTRRRGVVFHMLSSIEPLATVGMTAIADAPHKAEELFAHARTILARADDTRGRQHHATPVRAALSTGE
jgi:PGM1 C-terminal domain